MEVNVCNVKKIIRGNMVLDDITYRFESGNVYGLVGRNGCGKTMLLRMITGLIKATDGEVYVDGKLIGKELDFPPDLGVVIEKPKLIEHMTGYENLKIIADIKKLMTDEDIKGWMEKFGLDSSLKQPVRKYSLGMKQKIGIIQAIMENPKILVLDEPFNALDVQSVELLRNIILELKEKGCLIIVTSHHEDDINAVCNKILYMNEGRLVLE